MCSIFGARREPLDEPTCHQRSVPQAIAAVAGRFVTGAFGANRWRLQRAIRPSPKCRFATSAQPLLAAVLAVGAMMAACSYPIEITFTGGPGGLEFRFDNCGELFHPVAHVTDVDIFALNRESNEKTRVLCSVRFAPSNKWVYGSGSSKCPQLLPGLYRIIASYPGHNGSREFRVSESGTIAPSGNGSCD